MNNPEKLVPNPEMISTFCIDKLLKRPCVYYIQLKSKNLTP
jgi:hypothetical protein